MSTFARRMYLLGPSSVATDNRRLRPLGRCGRSSMRWRLAMRPTALRPPGART